MEDNTMINRRDFIRTSVLAGGALFAQMAIPSGAALKTAGTVLVDADKGCPCIAFPLIRQDMCRRRPGHNPYFP